jgi:serine/threonine-protein kinase HipA
MGRRKKARRLDVRMNGEKVGAWSIGASGEHAFAYDPSWPESEFARPISLSLPLRPPDIPYRGPQVEAFFDNLLPDSATIRKRFQSRYGLPSAEAFDLLAEMGRDCVGALQILPADADPGNLRTIRGQILGEAGIAAALRALVSPLPFGRTDDDAFRISLAGAQEKTAFLKHKGRWLRPQGATPTTHIFKLPMGDRIGKDGIDLSASVEIEWLSARLVAAFGLPIAPSEILRFEDQKVLAVERFDRALAEDGTWWVRLPQEDICQALGVPIGRKYEADGAPGMGDILKFLLGSREALADRRTFLKTQILFWLLAAVDGHARNFSLFLGRRGAFRLTPLYDVISAYPVLGHGRNRLAPEKAKMAMAVRGRGKHYHWDRITVRHWRESAAAWGMTGEIESILSELSEAAREAASRVAAELPKDFPASVAEPIFKGLKKAIVRLEPA